MSSTKAALAQKGAALLGNLRRSASHIAGGGSSSSSTGAGKSGSTLEPIATSAAGAGDSSASAASPGGLKSPIAPTPVSAEPPGLVFGAPLTTDPAQLENGVPRFVYRAVAYLLERGLATEGIFRMAGSIAQVKQLCAAYDRGEDPDLVELAKNPHVVANALKRYFRALPEPLVPIEYYGLFIVAVTIPIRQQRLVMLQRLVMTNLPQPNRDLLFFMLKFLRVVSYYQEANKMTSNNLALVFAPNLLWEVKADGSHSMQDEATDSPLMAQLLTVLIDDYDILFGDVTAPSLPPYPNAAADAERDRPRKMPRTVFFEAIDAGNLDAAAALVDGKEVDVDIADDDGLTALMRVVSNRDDAATVERLLALGTNPNAHSQTHGESALGLAAELNHIASVKALLAGGAKTTEIDHEGWTPVTLAVANGHLEATTVLLDHGADPSAPQGAGSTGKTPVILAAFGGHEDVARLLLARSADVNAMDRFGWSALMLAAYSGHVGIVKLLLDHGASPAMASAKGETAESIARDRGFEAIVALLEAPVSVAAPQTPGLESVPAA